jgi:hypothetical protein
MKLEGVAGKVGGGMSEEPQEAFSAAWWQQRTPEELRDIIKRGFSGGPAFAGAVAEAERRAREETQRIRADAAAGAELRRRRRKSMAAVAGGILLAIAVISIAVVFLA